MDQQNTTKEQEKQNDFVELPWIEKYRPTKIKEIVGNEEAVLRLQAISADGNMPNLILSGPPGIGKTTSITCLAKQLLGDSYKKAVLELNASDERGIAVVREKIKLFAKKKVSLPPGRHKIVILDEADSMTSPAQQAMRRIMEEYTSSTRFALACNFSNKIIEPIQSRCAVLRFSKLEPKQIIKRIQQIAQAEGVSFTNEGLSMLILTSDGDMRHAINNLQATYFGFGTVNDKNVLKVVDIPHPNVIKDIIVSCKNGDIKKAANDLTELHRKGYAVLDILGTMFRVIKGFPDEELPEFQKLVFIKEIGFFHKRALEGVDTMVQMTGLLAQLCSISLQKKNSQRK